MQKTSNQKRQGVLRASDFHQQLESLKPGSPIAGYVGITNEYKGCVTWPYIPICRHRIYLRPGLEINDNFDAGVEVFV